VLILTKQKEWPKELVLIDFKRKKFEFYNIEFLTVGYNDIQVICHSGKLTGNGISRVKQFKGKDSYKEAIKFAYKKFYEKKDVGFISLKKMEEGVKFAYKQEELMNKEKKNKKVVSQEQKHKCDLCHQPIHFSLFQKINSWGRGEGNWDYNSKSPLYKKVVCLDCQIDKGIFQKRIDEAFRL
jgi:hypothetical protein